jgi:hypothetical protein
MFFAISNCVCNSNNEPIDIFRKRNNSLLLSLPNPSAILLGIEIALLFICDVNPKTSSFGKLFVTVYFSNQNH